MAGVELHRRIIAHTLARDSDQQHIDVVHVSRASIIHDRTAFILGAIRQNPAFDMFEAADMSIRMFADIGKQTVLGVPCNTFHAPAIFEPFAARFEAPAATVVHMLEETVAYIRDFFPAVKRIGLLCTTGTRQSNVWPALLEARGIAVLQVPPLLQNKVHASIYDPPDGLKARTPASSQTRRLLEGAAVSLLQQGAEAVLLGCTELHMALPGSVFHGKPLIDPLTALARALVRESAPEKLLPLAAAAKDYSGKHNGLRAKVPGMRTGILGGSFNPVHTGHLLMAQDAMEFFSLDRVLFVPCALPPHKDDNGLAPAVCRAAMLQAAVAGIPFFEVCTMELERGGRSYTIDTVRELRRRYCEDDFFFIIGDDSLAELPKWRRIDELLDLCRIVTLARPGVVLAEKVPELGRERREHLRRHRRIGHALNVSSTEIRERVASGRPISYLVPGDVAQYIARHRLYATAPGSIAGGLPVVRKE